MSAVLRAPPITVILAGEIDIATTPAIRQALMAAIGGGQSQLAVSMSAVRFIDASGIGVLVAAANAARAAGGDLLLQDPSPQLRKLLSILNLNTSLRAAGLRGGTANRRLVFSGC